MKKIDNILNKDINKLIYKERQLIIDYFRKLANDEFYNWKNIFIQKSKEKIFKRVYLIDAYDNMRIRLCSLSFITIAYLLKYQKNNFIDYMYNADVNDSVFEYYDSIEEIIKEVLKLKLENETKVEWSVKRK